MRRFFLSLLPWAPSDTLSSAITKLGVWLGAILVPLYDVLGAVLVLVVIDFLTGIGAALKTKEGLSSKKLINTVNKFLFYSLTLLAAHVVELKITPALPWLQVVSGFIALTELRSVFENFNRIFGLNVWEYVKTLIKQTKFGEDLLRNLSKDPKKTEQDE